MQTPTTLRDTAKELDTTSKWILKQLSTAGHIRRDPMTDEWRVTRAGVMAGTVVELTRTYPHPVVGLKQYTQVQVTAEGRRYLKQQRVNAA